MVIKNKNMSYNKEHTWEFNLIQSVRWDTEDARDDVCHFIKNNMANILDADEVFDNANSMHFEDFEEYLESFDS